MLFLSKGAHETSSDRGAKKTSKKTNTKTQTSQLSMQLKKEKKKKKTDIVYNIWEEGEGFVFPVLHSFGVYFPASARVTPGKRWWI